jgi:ABC-type multidrug transport system permease subunit
MTEVFVYMFPGMVYFWIFFIVQDPMLEILQEKEAHTLPRLLAAPVTVSQFLLSKMLRCFALASVVQALLFLVSAGLFDTRWGNPFLLLLVIVVCAFSVTGLLGGVYAMTTTKEQAGSLTYIVVILCAFVGGSFFPYDELPGFLKVIGQFTPNRWGILATHTVAYDKPPTELIKPLAILASIGLVGSITALALFRRRFSRGGGL